MSKVGTFADIRVHAMTRSLALPRFACAYYGVRSHMSLVVLRSAPSSACGALPEIRQDGLPKPDGPPGTRTDPPTLAAQNFLTRHPLKKLKVRA